MIRYMESRRCFNCWIVAALSLLARLDPFVGDELVGEALDPMPGIGVE